jgi:AcrR family transcriptional regulator
LRLQSIAGDIGISHSSILHHFGSREGLLRALSEDALRALDRDLLATLEAPPDEGENPAERASALLARIARTLGDEGHAKLLAWQFISGRLPLTPSGAEAPPAPPSTDTPRAHAAKPGVPETTVHEPMLGRIAETIHRVRTEQARRHDLPLPELDDTRAFVLMIACSLFGEALAGGIFTQSVGLDPSDAGRERYRRWLAEQSTAILFEER